MLNENYPGSPSAPAEAQLAPARPAPGRAYNDDARLNPWGLSDSTAVLPRRLVEEVPADNSLRQLFSMLMRRKAILLATLLLVLGVTLAYMMLTPSVYDAKATLQIHAADGSGGNDGDSGHTSLVMYAGNGSGGDHSFGTQLTILQSPPVRRAAIERLPEEVQAKLKSFLNVSIQPVAETTLVEIRVSSHDPEASALLANAYCEEYIHLSRASNREQLQTALDYVNLQKDKIGDKLNAARLSVQRFKEQNQLMSVEAHAAAVSGALYGVQTERENLKAEQAEVRAGIQRSMQLIPTMSQYRVLPGSTTIRPEVAAIKSKISALSLERLELLQKYREDRPEIQIIDDQIRDLRARLQTEAKTEISSWSNALNDRREGLEKNLIELQARDWAMQARDVALAQAATQASSKLSQMPALERQMSDMMLTLAGLEKSYTVLEEKQEMLRMSQEAKVANGSRLFVAETPTSPSSRLLKMMGSALLIGLLLALALSALVDWLDDGVYGETEAKMVSQLPILAQIPYINKAAQKKLTTGADASAQDRQISYMRENFRMLRTMIALSSGPDLGYASGNGNGHAALNAPGTLATTDTPLGASPIRSVVITSSLPNEGKSVSSTNLAISTALSGENVILVDCDLRHPSLHRFFDLPNDIGLTSVVGGACSLNDALQDTRIPGLRVLSSGPVTLDPMQIINSAGARRCFAQLTEVADFVVIDTPPALVYAEAQVVAAMTDAMLLVISSQDSKKREVGRTRDLLEQTGMIPIGAILNKVPSGSDITERYYERYSA